MCGHQVVSLHCRDNSASTCLRRVPILGTNGQQFADEWLEFYNKRAEEKEFPLRHTQVGVSLAPYTGGGGHWDLILCMVSLSAANHMVSASFPSP